MFCIVYSFSVKPLREADFASSWHALTLYIYDHNGSLGSRLHKAKDGAFIAYAQWPSRELWESPTQTSSEWDTLLSQLRSSCSRIETLLELHPVT